MSEKTGTELMMKNYAKTRIRAASGDYAHTTFNAAHDRGVAREGFEAGAEWAMAQVVASFDLKPKVEIGQITAWLAQKG